MNTALLFVGTYTEPEDSHSEGIYIYRMDSSSGELTFERVIQGIANPSYLTVHPQHNFLYAVNEVENFAGEAGGGISAFSLDPGSGELTLLNQQPAQGRDPCYVSIDQAGRYALVANYTSGSVVLFPILADGALGPAAQVIQESGSSVNSERQDDPHAHCFIPDPKNNFAIEANLGLDKLLVYRVDLDQGRLDKHSEIMTQPGAGPRHIVFHPNGEYLYLINELNSTLTSYRYHAGRLEELQTVSALPPEFQDKNTGADVHISPDGKFLYGSNRGHDSIVCFQIDEATGKLTYICHTPCRGQEPRNFAIDPSGAFMLVANQKSNTIVIFAINPETGVLSRTGHAIEVSMPVCLKFAILRP